MRGNLALEQNHWQTACNEYQSALTLCESLASNIGIGSGDDSTKEQDDGKNDLQQLRYQFNMCGPSDNSFSSSAGQFESVDLGHSCLEANRAEKQI